MSIAIFNCGQPEKAKKIEISFESHYDKTQMAIWVEDSLGNHVKTIFITNVTGKYGLGNRPGSGENRQNHWSYGKRFSALPVWAYKRNASKPYRMIMFQHGTDGTEGSQPQYESPEPYYSYLGARFTDKGKYYEDGRTCVYPPRNDLTAFYPQDHPDAQQYAEANDLDAVTGATPGYGKVTKTWECPNLPNGTYTYWIEVNRSFDPNDTWPLENSCYSGQPSVVWSGKITVGATPDTSEGKIVGHGSWDGSSGDLYTDMTGFDDRALRLISNVKAIYYPGTSAKSFP